MEFLDWYSDGFVAFFALVLYGVILLLLVLPRARKNPILNRLVRPAILWHFAVFLFTALYVLPHYAGATGADCYGYHMEGLRLAQVLRDGNWSEVPWGVSTAATNLITGILYLPFGGDVYGMMFFSSVLGLCGSFYFCLAFAEQSDPAQTKRYTKVILFLPSIAMWSGIFGKDSWIAMGLGLAAYGYASILKARGGFGYLLIGIILTTIIRPHISIAFVAAAATAYILGLTRSRRASILAKIGTTIVLITMLGALALVAQRFLKLDDVSAESLEQYGEARGAGNAQGGSEVQINSAHGVAGTLIGFPRAAVRILLQPFPWEARNFSLALAAAENIYILWFICIRLRRIRRLVREITREPYILFSAILALGLLLTFSLTPNLGLLSRQRVQLLPFFFAALVAAEGYHRRPAIMSRRVSPQYQSMAPSAPLQPVLRSK